MSIMKNLLLTGVALMAISAATFAQNNQTTVFQIGNYSQASADQKGTFNSAQFVQDGNGASASRMNKAQINQQGAGTSVLRNTGLVFQTGNGHTVRLTQQGDASDNFAQFTQNQANATANATQSGTRNAIFSTQRSALGTAVEATIQQTGNRNRIEISGQTDVIDAEDGTSAFITQMGNDNFVNLSQLGDGNKASVGQMGNWSEAYIAQRGVLHKLVVNQTSVGSTSTRFNLVNIDQRGTRGDIQATQTGNDNRIRLFSDGDFNTANMTQSGTGHAVRGVGNTFAQQVGNRNTLTTSQNGNDQTISSTQNGNFNSAFVVQNNQ